jgi:transposase-like protein
MPDALAVRPACGANGAYRLRPKAESRRPVRPGVLKCRACRRQFAVTVGTIFEDSHIPLRKWLVGIQVLCAGRDGVGARDLRRVLGVSYKTASFMTSRLRRAIARAAVPHAGAGQGTPDGRLGRVIRSLVAVGRARRIKARPQSRRATGGLNRGQPGPPAEGLIDEPAVDGGWTAWFVKSTEFSRLTSFGGPGRNGVAVRIPGLKSLVHRT